MSTISLTSPRHAPYAPAPMPMRRVFGAYLAEARFETVRHLKTPAFALPFLIIPVALYLFFSIVALNAANTPPDPALRVDIRMFTGFGIVGVMGPALFAFGMAVAVDRDFGLLRLKRALPMPPMAYLLGKMGMSMLFSALVMLMMVVAALFKGLDVPLVRLAAVWAIGVVGTLPFCAMGLFIGSRVSGRSAPAWVNLAYLPMTYLSGLFFPMPESIRTIVLVSPAFHINQLALQAAGVSGILPATWHVGALAGITVLFAGLAARRVMKMD